MINKRNLTSILGAGMIALTSNPVNANQKTPEWVKSNQETIESCLKESRPIGMAYSSSKGNDRIKLGLLTGGVMYDCIGKRVSVSSDDIIDLLGIAITEIPENRSIFDDLIKVPVAEQTSSIIDLENNIINYDLPEVESSFSFFGSKSKSS